MSQLSEKSIQKLYLAHQDLSRLFMAVAEKTAFEVVQTHIEPKEYIIKVAQGQTHLQASESLFCSLPTKCLVAVAVVDGVVSWNLQNARKFRDIVYETAKELDIYVKCGRNLFRYNDVDDWKNHYFELVSYE
jgi:hypothetical protein